MSPIAHNDHGVILPGMLFNDALHVSHLRTGGVDDFDAAFLDFLSFVGCDAVGADDQDAAFRVVNFSNAAHGGDAPGL